MNKIDTRGYSCPEPVLMTKKALEKGLPLTVLAESEIPLQNICRYVSNAGYKCSYKAIDDGYEITIE